MRCKEDEIGRSGKYCGAVGNAYERNPISDYGTWLGTRCNLDILYPCQNSDMSSANNVIRLE